MEVVGIVSIVSIATIWKYGYYIWLMVTGQGSFFSICWECHHPIDELIFARGVGSTTRVPLVNHTRWCPRSYKLGYDPICYEYIYQKS